MVDKRDALRDKHIKVAELIWSNITGRCEFDIDDDTLNEVLCDLADIL